MDGEVALLTRRATLLTERIARTQDVFLRRNLAGDLAHVNHRIDLLLRAAA